MTEEAEGVGIDDARRGRRERSRAAPAAVDRQPSALVARLDAGEVRLIVYGGGTSESAVVEIGDSQIFLEAAAPSGAPVTSCAALQFRCYRPDTSPGHWVVTDTVRDMVRIDESASTTARGTYAEIDGPDGLPYHVEMSREGRATLLPEPITSAFPWPAGVTSDDLDVWPLAHWQLAGVACS